MNVNEGWAHTWDDDDGSIETDESHDCTPGVCDPAKNLHGCAVWGTPFDTSCIWAPRGDDDPTPYADYAGAGDGNRFTLEEIHPGGVIPPVDGIQFAH